VRLNEKLLPLLKKQKEAAIVNVSSIVSVVPNARMAGYGASKAALHSYSLSLRLLLSRSTGVKVFEIQPPLVDTEFSVEIGGKNGIAPSVVAEELKKGFENDTYEIRVGRTEDIYRLYLQSPEQALAALNPQPQKA
ncbi:MAG TPA: SDR family NAD(P)-dependent oxidoreductase, partial [Puia sp.]|nr:SDR family NAD(P)-dependent oxidoreductase [Puia sp.]